MTLFDKLVRICRGLILLHPLSQSILSRRLMERGVCPANMVNGNEGVIELDPYTRRILIHLSNCIIGPYTRSLARRTATCGGNEYRPNDT